MKELEAETAARQVRSVAGGDVELAVELLDHRQEIADLKARLAKIAPENPEAMPPLKPQTYRGAAGAVREAAQQ